MLRQHHLRSEAPAAEQSRVGRPGGWSSPERGSAKPNKGIVPCTGSTPFHSRFFFMFINVVAFPALSVESKVVN